MILGISRTRNNLVLLQGTGEGTFHQDLALCWEQRELLGPHLGHHFPTTFASTPATPTPIKPLECLFKREQKGLLGFLAPWAGGPGRTRKGAGALWQRVHCGAVSVFSQMCAGGLVTNRFCMALLALEIGKLTGIVRNREFSSAVMLRVFRGTRSLSPDLSHRAGRGFSRSLSPVYCYHSSASCPSVHQFVHLVLKTAWVIVQLQCLLPIASSPPSPC